MSVWSCRPGQLRFFEPAASPHADLAGYDQQRFVRYLVIDDANALLADQRSKFAYRRTERVLTRELAPVLGLPDEAELRGTLEDTGAIAGGTVYLLAEHEGLLCKVGVPDAPNPFTVCRLAATPRMIEIQLPNGELPRLANLLKRARRLTPFVEGR